VVLPTAILIAGVTGFLLTRVLKAHKRVPVTGYEGLVGEIGEALGEIGVKGKVLVHGEYWDARSVAGAIDSGSEVKVVAVSGRRLDVKPAKEPAEGE
jgi:membrane-bound ClpP family serine protease